MVTDGAGRIRTGEIESVKLSGVAKNTRSQQIKSKVKNFKGWWVSFDWSMFEGDGLTSIQYLGRETDMELVICQQSSDR